MSKRAVVENERARQLPTWGLAHLLPVLIGCAPTESDAVSWYEADAARIQAFDQWLRDAVDELPGVTRKDELIQSLAAFDDACKVQLDRLGVAEARAVWAHTPLPAGHSPANGLCPGYSSPGWSRDGQPAKVSDVGRDVYKLGWGEYWDEAQEDHSPGYEVWWEFRAGDAIVEVDLLLPKPPDP